MGAATSYVAVKGGVPGTIAVICLLILGALAIIRQASHNRVDFSNVNDASEVVVVKQDPALGVSRGRWTRCAPRSSMA